MRKNFDMDAAIRRALRESIEAHAHEWEPKFETGVGPVGDDAPFDNKVSEGCDKEEACCPKCGKEKCVCGDMNEGTIPGDSHEWDPGFETGVGPVGDDSPFTQAVNEAFVEGGDWEKDSFGAPNHKKEGISFADGGDECQNGVVATSQKNSGEVVSSDNLSEGEDEESQDEWGEKTRFRMQDVQPAQPVQESVESENDIIAEERDRFFDIINRIEKLYD